MGKGKAGKWKREKETEKGDKERKRKGEGNEKEGTLSLPPPNFGRGWLTKGVLHWNGIFLL